MLVQPSKPSDPPRPLAVDADDAVAARWGPGGRCRRLSSLEVGFGRAVRPVPPWSDGPLVPRTALRRPRAGGAGDRVDHLWMRVPSAVGVRRDTAMSVIVLRAAQVVGVLVLSCIAVGVVVGLVQWL